MGTHSLSRRTRWLVLTQYYAPEIGAPQIRLRSMVRELVRHGIDVEVLTGMPNYPAGRLFPGYEGRWRAVEQIDGVKVKRTWIYAGTGRSARVRLCNYLSFTFMALLRTLFAPRPDVLFLESQPLSLGIVAVVLKWLRGVPYIYNVPDLQVDVARQLGFIRSERMLRLALAMEDLFLREAWKISTVTDKFIEHFMARGCPRSQLTFLPNGADTRFLMPQPRDAELEQRWGLAGRKTFAYVGTHAFYHGLDTLLDAATLLKDRSDLAFLLVGDGPERPRLMQIAEQRGLGNVVFGRSPYEEMARLYSVAYGSIATLRNIEVASGMRLSKIFPALSCAVPMIYSGAGEAAQLIADERCGLVVRPESAEELAAAVTHLAANPALRDELGRRGRALVERDYGWRAIVARWLAEIEHRPDSSAEKRAVAWLRRARSAEIPEES